MMLPASVSSAAPASDAPAAGAWRLSVLTDRRIVAMLGLGIAQGVPLLLVYASLSIWLRQAHVALSTIGLLSELTLAYKFKFLWAPFLDRFDPPLLGAWLGRRRGWIVAAQIGVMVALAGIAFGDPATRLVWTAGFALALGFAGATQDTVIDGWRIAVAPDLKAQMSSIGEIGWRIGTLIGGAGALVLSDHVGWRGAYLCMILAIAPGVVGALLAPEPETDKVASPARLAENRRGFVETIWAPIQELIGRLGSMALPILLLVAGFRMPGYVSGVMENPLFTDLHYSSTDIATVTKVYGFWLAIAATFLGGWLVVRLGMMPTLLIGTVFGSASHLALAYLAVHGGKGDGEFWLFAITVSIDNFAYAFASIVLITYMSKLCASELAASQFALLTSLVALPGSVLALSSGFIVERVGYVHFFVATSLIGVPVAILCLWVWRQHALPQPEATV
jgi:PAT family beta-lactamase induction signal transducer AmpG